jgi:hypothetical protein
MGINPCTATCPTAPDPTSLPRRAPVLPHAPRLRPRLPAQEGSDAAMCYTALDPASLLRRAPVLPCATWLWTLPPYSGGLWWCHVPHGSGPCLPAREGSDAVTCPEALKERLSWPTYAARCKAQKFANLQNCFNSN